MQPQINDLIKLRLQHLDAAHPIKDMPVMAKFYKQHIDEARKLQEQIQDILRQERFKKADMERMKQVVTKHVSVRPTNQPQSTQKGKV